MGPAPARSVDGGSPPIGGPVGVVGLVHLAVCRHRSVVVDIVRVIGLSVVCRWSVGGCLYLFGMSAGRRSEERRVGKGYMAECMREDGYVKGDTVAEKDRDKIWSES